MKYYLISIFILVFYGCKTSVNNFIEIDKKLKLKNDQMSFIQDSIFQIETVTTYKDSPDSFIYNMLFDFRTFDKNREFYCLWQPYKYIYKYKNDTLFRRLDSNSIWEYYSDAKVNFTKNEIDNKFTNLYNLPFTSFEFYNTYRSYKTGYDSASGLNVLFQQNKKRKELREIYFDDKYNFKKSRTIYLSKNYPGDIENWEIKKYKDSSFEELASKLGYIKEFESQEQKKENEEILTESNVINKIKDSGTILNKRKFLIIDFWYLSCQPCFELRQHLEKIYAESDTSKVIFFGMNPYDKKSSIDFYLKRYNYLIPELHFDKKWIQQEDSSYSFPTVILVSPEGVIVKRWIGYDMQTVREIRKRISDL